MRVIHSFKLAAAFALSGVTAASISGLGAVPVIQQHSDTAYSNSTDITHTLDKRADLNYGRATFFYVGLGACGGYSTDDQYVVALAEIIWNSGMVDDNPNHNKYCGKPVWITYGGKTIKATIVDLCPISGGCHPGDGAALDMSPSLFSAFASQSLGVFNMQWSWSPPGGSDGDDDDQAAAKAAAAAKSKSSADAAWAYEQSTSKAAASKSAAAAYAASVSWDSVLSVSSASVASVRAEAKAESIASVSSASVAKARQALQSASATSTSTSAKSTSTGKGRKTVSDDEDSTMAAVNQLLLNLANMISTAVKVMDD